MHPQPLGNTGIDVTPIGFGTVKIGRNEGLKYPHQYPLPSEVQAGALLNGALDLGINLIDTAPAYGLSETRIGQALAPRRDEYVLCTKVGETFAHGQSTHDFSPKAIGASVEQSLANLRTDVLDILLLHSDGQHEQHLQETQTVPALLEMRDRGLVRSVGLSGKTEAGFRAAFAWADVLMVEYSQSAPDLGQVITDAHHRGLGVMVKKGLGSGHLTQPGQAINFVLQHPGVHTLIVGGANLDHLRANIASVRV